MLALNQGWNLFSKNMGPLLAASFLATVLPVVIWLFLGGMQFVSVVLASPEDTEAITRAANASPFPTLVRNILTLAGTLMLYNAAKHAAAGKRIDFGDIVAGLPWLPAIVVAIIAGLGSSVGIIGCCVGFFATLALFQYAVPAVMSGASIGDSLQESFGLGSKNFWPSVMLALLAFAALLVGYMLCGIGILVAAPVVACMYFAAYRQLRGEPVAV